MKKIALMTALLLVATLLFTACSNEKKLIGTWTTTDSFLGLSVDSTLTFREGGTGTLDNLATTYEIKDGKLFITTALLGISKTTEYTYSVKGDTLTLTDTDGAVTVYTKKN